MASSTKQAFNPADFSSLLADFDKDQVGDLPSFDPFPAGIYKGLGLKVESITSGSLEDKQYWERIDVSFVLLENTQVQLAKADATLPADGSQTTITITTHRYCPITDKIIQVTGKHIARGRDGDEYEAKGSYAMANKDLILPTNGQIQAKDIPTLFTKFLATAKHADATFGLRSGKVNETTGETPIYQTITALKYIV